jgi:hypothetical protein
LDTTDAGAESALVPEVSVSLGEYHESPPLLVEEAAFVGEWSQLCSLADEARDGGGAGGQSRSMLMVLGEDQGPRGSSTDESVDVGAESQPVDDGDVGRGSSESVRKHASELSVDCVLPAVSKVDDSGIVKIWPESASSPLDWYLAQHERPPELAVPKLATERVLPA